MNYNCQPSVFLPSMRPKNLIFYSPINTYIPVNKSSQSCFYYEDFWGVKNRNDIRHILFPEKKTKVILTINTDLNTFAESFTPSPDTNVTISDFFEFPENCEFEELEPEIELDSEVLKPEPMATLVKTPESVKSASVKSPKKSKNKKW